MYEIITKKKKGLELTREEIAFFVGGFTKGEIPDYQAASLLMAICLKGMTPEETAILTDEMMRSGDVLDLSSLGENTVDKHSTGGVGDKTTLILAPIVAAAGATVAKMSGRGLGHTGGTVDKMESVPGMKVDLSSQDFFKTAKEVGICVVGQSGSLAPADKKIYALRDVSATVDSIPLIASSIMSKKLASGSKSIVLDVKYGSGAFMKTPEEAKELAMAMVSIGKKMGRKVRALITDMDTPLGTHIGNALEVKEAIEILKGEGDRELKDLCLALSTHMLALALSLPEEKAQALASSILSSGKALLKMKEWFSAQGGDERVVENVDLLPCAPYRHTVYAKKEGFIYAMNSEKIGLSAGDLGAGRKQKTDVIDPGAGIVLLKKKGDFVKEGDALAHLFASEKSLFEKGEKCFLEAVEISENRPEKNKLIYDVII